MSFIVDTSILIEIEKDNKEIISKIEELDLEGDIFITAPTYSEFVYGLSKFPAQKFRLGIDRLENYGLLNTTKKSSRLMAQIKHELEKSGNAIPLFDMFIASIAMDNSMQLLTLDKHFTRIKGLNVSLI